MGLLSGVLRRQRGSDLGTFAHRVASMAGNRSARCAVTQITRGEHMGGGFVIGPSREAPPVSRAVNAARESLRTPGSIPFPARRPSSVPVTGMAPEADSQRELTPFPGWPLRPSAAASLEPRGQMLQRCGGVTCPPGACGHAPSIAPAIVHEVLAAPGTPMDPALRDGMERQLGHDFGAVRLHADSRAADSAAAVASLAYTVGNHVVLGRAADVSREPGRRILAHELVHTLQQGGERAPGIPARLEVAASDSTAEQEAERGASSVRSGTAPVVQRRCGNELGTPVPACEPSTEGVVGWQFLFKVGCDDLQPGEAEKIDRLRVGYSLEVHGFASREGPAGFNDDLSCHRANRIADLARARRADCPVTGTYRHGASPPDTPGRARDPHPPDFWRSVVVRQIPPTQSPGEQWLDPASTISRSQALYARAQRDPTQANLDIVAGLRPQLRTWLESISRTLAPEGAQLTQRNLSDYRQTYSSAEHLWANIDQLLALQRHPAAASDTYQAWAAGTGTRDQGSRFHATGVPTGARYHVDIFGEGYFPGAVNIGMATRSSTTGVSGTRVPNLIYRRFSGTDLNRLPIADHAADVVTSENGPLGLPGLAEEIARIIAPGGTIVLFGPENMEPVHDKIARLAGGTVTKVRKDRVLETRIAVPAP